MNIEPDLPRHTILIIDDIPANLAVVVDYLEEAGFEVMAARNGEIGLDIAQRAQPDLILLDVLMPGMDGFETCARLKANELTRAIPVIFMTALTSTEDKVKGFTVGGVDYVTKPLQQGEVLARVTTHLKLKDLTQHLQKANQDLIKLNADKDKFLSIIAHDLRAPFMPVIGAAEMLLEVDQTYSLENVKELSRVIYLSSRKVADLLDNLLQWSRMQLGRIPYLPSQLNLMKVIERNIALFTQNAITKQITLQSHLSQPLFVYADENMLDTIIRNLTSNAIKFTPSGGTVTLTARIQDASFVQIAVIDTGVGLNQEEIDQLFKTGAHRSTFGTADERGTGLGLLLCQEMIAQHGGQIWLESEPGCGTTVKFTIPQG